MEAAMVIDVSEALLLAEFELCIMDGDFNGVCCERMLKVFVNKSKVLVFSRRAVAMQYY